MEPDEKFVVDTLVSNLGGIASEGDDPPDAYLSLDGKTIGIEVSQLVQRIIDENGMMRSRNTDDVPGIRIAEELNAEIGHQIPEDQFVSLIIRPPIEKVRKTKQKLSSTILEMVKTNSEFSVEEIFGNEIHINFYDQTGIEKKKISAGISNRYSTSDIGGNARIVLEDRIFQKNQKISATARCDEWWLVLLNQYWIADLETYKHVFPNIKTKHNFSRIYIVSDRRELLRLC